MSLKNSHRLAILVVFVVVISCGDKTQQGMQAPPPVQVVVHEVKSAIAQYYDEYPAVIRALNEVELRPQVAGYVTAMHFVEGSKVKKGQKLYSIDPQVYEGNYKQALANLSSQEANLEKAKKDVERYRELSKNDAIAKQQVDYAEATYSAAIQQVEAAKASVQSMQTNVRYATIVAPFDGTIGISSVRLGASVSPGQTVLNTISSDDPIGADITVDQKEIYRFTQLRESAPKNDSTFRLAFGDLTYPHPGKISIIDRAVDPLTNTLRMRLTFPNPDHTLRAGMSATLKVLSGSTEKSVVIPYKAVNELLGEFFVYVVDSAKVTQRRITLGKQVGMQIIVKDGLKAGETIVTEGVQSLREGSAITVAQPTQPGAQPAAKK